MKTILISSPNTKYHENPSSSNGIKTVDGRADRQTNNSPVILHAVQITQHKETLILHMMR
jgi:hypothetical protein